jgi:hypothetical protein
VGVRDGAASTAPSETFGVGDGATSAAGLGGLCSIMVFSDDQRNCLQIMLDFHEFLFGTMSTPSTNSRWPNFLAARLLNHLSHRDVAVLDQGIGRHAVLHEFLDPNALESPRRP